MDYEMVKNYLESKNVCLASASPRRREIFSKIIDNFETTSSNFEASVECNQMYNENTSKFPQNMDTCVKYVYTMAGGKMSDILSRNSSWDVVITSDTVVVKNGKIFEKPRNENEALEMLKTFNNNVHQVVTVVSVNMNSLEKLNSKNLTFHQTTNVYFSNSKIKTLINYIETGEYVDKAGGYGIQSKGAILIEKIQGCYYNVMGFPLNAFIREMTEFLKN